MTLANTEIIIITAGNGSWVRNVLHPGSWVRQWGEGLIGDYRKQMQILRRVDDNIAIWTEDLDYLVKEARKAFKSKRMVDLSLVLANLNKKLKAVTLEGKKVEVVRDKALRQFEAEHKIELPENFNLKELPYSNADDGLTSLAGWTDFKRKWFARRLEDKQREMRDKAVDGLLHHTDVTVKSIKRLLNNLGEARDKGNIGTYITIIGEIAKEQQSFERLFTSVYFKYLQKYLQEAYEAKLNKEDQENILLKQQEELATKNVQPLIPTENNPQIEKNVSQQVVNNVPPAPVNLKTNIPTKEEEYPPSVPTLPASKLPITQPQSELPNSELFPASEEAETLKGPGKVGPIENDEVDSEPTRRSNELEEVLQRTSHAYFVNQLIVVGEQNNPYLMAAMIVKYAGMVEDYDLEKSLELMAIAEYILDE